jgi:hypothetical protein
LPAGSDHDTSESEDEIRVKDADGFQGPDDGEEAEGQELAIPTPKDPHGTSMHV